MDEIHDRFSPHSNLKGFDKLDAPLTKTALLSIERLGQYKRHPLFIKNYGFFIIC